MADKDKCSEAIENMDEAKAIKKQIDQESGNKNGSLDYAKIITTACEGLVNQYKTDAVTDKGKETTLKIANRMAKIIMKEFGKEAYQYINKASDLAIELDNDNSEARMAIINRATDCLITKATGTNVLDTENAKRFMLRTKKGGIQPSASENCRLIFSQDPHYQGLLRYNDFTEKPEYRESRQTGFKQLKDDFAKKLSAEVQRYYRFIPSERAVADGIVLASQSNSYNPVKERIESVQWDGKKRAANFFIDYLGADNTPYVKAVTETWLVGAIARVYRPGVKFDMVPILNDRQGTGKSTLVSLLTPPQYFLDDLSSLSGSKDKDNLLKIHDSWIVEIGELDAMGKTGIAETKAFISRQNDQYRSPYGHYNGGHPRKNVFIGTVNQSEYLHDLTGNRRFYPIHCEKDRATKKIPEPGDYNNPDILQVLAEAKFLFDKGHPLMLSKKMEAIAHEKQAEATVMDMQTSLMLQYSELLVPDDWDEFSIYQRQQYFKAFKEHGEYRKYNQNIKEFQIIPQNQLHKLSQFTNAELLEVVFQQDGREIARGGRNGLTSKISMVFGNDPHWKKTNHTKLFGKEKKGYKRTAD
ncbi:virulence-associated E family protein [Limosilactobacillus reuteri]|uniref:virulence-associated E family protein n=1 Tax=Limosilactobacillus reuteri TaxID=1598 RepID=UPI001E4FE646|nr:virulence-associated E family protein [Limosilactobacillus reuteri]MCC4398955.1 virulence-associated E family protein [Limosilactobacillus reuteri]MCC4402966.1 virulence-associated E family protein [Limosilactobacillus reuteri]